MVWKGQDVGKKEWALPSGPMTKVVEEFVAAMLSKIILMMPKTQVKNQESSKFPESKILSIKIQYSSKESREYSIKISIKRVFQNIE